MSIPVSPTANLYGIGVGTASTAGLVPVVSTRAPLSSDIAYKVGQQWIEQNSGGDSVYELTSFTTSSGSIQANWLQVATESSNLSELTGNTGGPVTPSAGNINIVGGNLASVSGSGHTLTINPTIGGYPITPYVVGSSGQAGYQTIQSAVTAASGVGASLIWIQPGTYTENVVFPNGCNLTLRAEEGGLTTITGEHTPPNTGSVTLDGFALTSSTDIFNSSASGSASLQIYNSFVSVTNGYWFDVVNWTGFLSVDNVGQAGTNDGVVNNTGGATIKFLNADIGAGTGNTLTLTGNGNVRFDTCNVNCPVNIGGSGTFVSQNGCVYRGSVTLGGSKTGTIVESCFITGAAAALTYSSSGNSSLSTCSINSSNNPAIAGSGSGTLTLGDITFLSNSSISGSLTLSWAATDLGNTTSTGTLASTGATTLATTGASTNTFGNSTGATSVAITSGSGGISLTATNAAFTAVSGTGALNISNDAAATTVNVGTGAGAKTVMIGSTNSTSATTIQAGSGNVSITAPTTVTGNLSLANAGNKLIIPTGSNASVGTSGAMSGTPGAVTVATTACSSTAKIFYSRNVTGGLPGEVSITAQSGTGFTLTSTGNETSTFNWWIINA